MHGAKNGLEVFDLEAPVVPSDQLSGAARKKADQRASGFGNFTEQRHRALNVGWPRRGAGFQKVAPSRGIQKPGKPSSDIPLRRCVGKEAQ